MAIMTYPHSYDRDATNGVCPAMRLENLVSESTGGDMFHTGDPVTFGMYPRSRVTDAGIISALNETVEVAPKKNLSVLEHRFYYDADYYTDYADMILGGNRYRAKVLYTDLITESTSPNTQPKEYKDYDYHYTEDGFDKYVYYYLFEPLTWRILNPETGLMVCDEIVDSIVYQNTHIKSDENDYYAEYAWADEEHTHYATDYTVSNMRDFLNGDFYDAAFTDEQKAKIKTVELDNRTQMTVNGITGYEQYDWESTSDKVFLLSPCDVLNPDYGFDPDPMAKDPQRVLYGNDYSGYPEGDSLDNWWPLRAGGDGAWYLSRRPGACTHSGQVGTTAAWANDTHPVVPAVCLSDLCSDFSGETAVCTQHIPATVTLTPATCTEDGEGREICSVCGEILTESVVLTAPGHTPGEEKMENETPSICTVAGSYESVVYCTVCGGEISRETVNTQPLGHDEIPHEGKSSTCKEKGWKPYVTCSRCDYTTYEELPLADHTPGEAAWENETDSTCTVAGEYDEIIKCSVCEKVLSTEHKTKELEAHKPLPAAKENEQPATCTEGGYYDSVVRCEVCRNILTSEHIDTGAAGHEYTYTVTPPTCTEKGYTTHTCHCGDSYKDSYKDPLGHSFTNYIYNNDATTEADGTETAKCDRCPVTYTRVKPGTRLNPQNPDTPTNPTAGAVLNVKASQTVDYRSKVTITASSSNVPAGYFLAIYDENGEVARGDNSSVSYYAGEMRETRTFTVKVIDAAGNVQKDAGGAELQKPCKAEVKTGFFDKIIAFFRNLFGLLPEVTIRP
ncbi:MAG: hypothetical protein IK097_08780 [Clostridia bacterium]|nr:hypothetical protein [Clostridia bacterium]